MKKWNLSLFTLLKAIAVLGVILVVLIKGGIIKTSFGTLETVISVPIKDISLENDIRYSFCFIEHELATSGTINTERMNIDEHGRELNKHIQKIYITIGHYSGDLNGDPSSTSSIVKQFQMSKNIKVDGVIGRDTWREIVKEFELKKLQ